jgi:hypothetical protein
MALTSFTKPAEISLLAIFCAVAPLSVGGATRHRSLRWAAAASSTSCVSVSLMDMDAPFASSIGAEPIQAPHRREPRIGAIAGAKGLPGSALAPPAIHTHAPFRTECQSFLRCRDMSLRYRVESRCGAVALGRACLFAAPFVCGALVAQP